MRTVTEILSAQFDNARMLETLKQANDVIRINVVTDSIGRESLFGGVATALTFATIMCRRNDWILRIVTRYTECNLKDYYDFMNYMGIETPKVVQAYSDLKRNPAVFNYKLTVSEKDVFLATSWWTAKGILDSNVTDKILYIIQEEETFFYPYGDQRLLCEQIMNSGNIDYIVNSKLLYDYLGEHGYNILISNSLYFEPAFEQKIYYADEDKICKKDSKKVMFFYGRPRNPRNLYYFGLKCLDEAITRGIIDTDIWDIYMAGNNVDDIEFSSGYHPIIKGQMSWKEYSEFAREVDLAFSLMYTPHPSYPPFDMLCSGAVVVTNEFANKKQLSYSQNMIIKPLDIEQLIRGIEEGIELSTDVKTRKVNYNNNNILRDWEESFKDIIPVIEERIRNGNYVCY